MPTLPASDNLFPSVLMAEAADPTTHPGDAAGQRRLVVGADGLLYLVNSAGVATLVGSDAAAIAAHAATSHGVTSHAALTGLAANDHPQYATDTDLTTHAATPHGGGVSPVAESAAARIYAYNTFR
jgi:hypothetical protein